MRLAPPIKGIRKNKPISPTPGDIYISQHFGNVWIAENDMTINGIFIAKGQNVYKVAFGMPGHNGTDIVAPRGTPILAPRDGYIIESVTKDTGLGLRVCMAWDYGEYQFVSVSGHLLKSAFPEIPWNLNNKQYFVREGQEVGYVDSTGFSTGDHDHWHGYQYKNGVRLNTNNGYNGAIDLWPYVKENYMEFFQVQNEHTIVMKNLDGKYIQIATSPELYPTVAKIFGLEGKSLEIVTRAEVDANYAGEAKAGISFSA